MMASCHIKHYTLSDNSVVTTREVARAVGISESAARNRLIRHKDIAKVYQPYDPAKGGKPPKKKKKIIKKTYDNNDWWRVFNRAFTKT